MIETNRKLIILFLGVLLACMPVIALANGATGAGTGAGTTDRDTVSPPSGTQGQGTVTTAQPDTTTGRVGRGPGETSPAIPAQIRQRGHVVNMAEAQQVMEALIQASGGQQTVGDYRVAYIIDPPRGWYQPANGQLTWRAPAAGETVHIEAVVLDALTGQMIPASPITVDVVDQAGTTVQSQQLNFLWHPMATHYGNNFSIPTAGAYTLRVRAPAPPIWRHDRQLGNRFAQPVEASFTNVQITPMTPPAGEANGAATGAGTGAGTTVTPSQPATTPACPPGTVPSQ